MLRSNTAKILLLSAALIISSSPDPMSHSCISKGVQKGVGLEPPEPINTVSSIVCDLW